MKQLISAKYKRFVYYVEIFIVILLLPLLYNFVPVNQGNRTFYIPSSNINDVTSILKKNGYSVTGIDRFLLQLIHTPDEGWYTVSPEKFGRIFFFEYLYRQKSDTMHIVVFAGETSEEMLSRLAKDLKLDKEILRQRYRALARFGEADIFADTYTIAKKADENSTMAYLFCCSQRILDHFEKKYFPLKPDTSVLKVPLTIASIIQKESNAG